MLAFNFRHHYPYWPPCLASSKKFVSAIPCWLRFPHSGFARSWPPSTSCLAILLPSPLQSASLRFFDADCSGYLSFDEFLVGLRGKLNPRRQEMVDLAFKVNPSAQPPPSLGVAQRSANCLWQRQTS